MNAHDMGRYMNTHTTNEAHYYSTHSSHADRRGPVVASSYPHSIRTLHHTSMCDRWEIPSLTLTVGGPLSLFTFGQVVDHPGLLLPSRPRTLLRSRGKAKNGQTRRWRSKRADRSPYTCREDETRACASSLTVSSSPGCSVTLSLSLFRRRRVRQLRAVGVYWMMEHTLSLSLSHVHGYLHTHASLHTWNVVADIIFTLTFNNENIIEKKTIHMHNLMQL